LCTTHAYLEIPSSTSLLQGLQALNHIACSLCSLGLVNQAAVPLSARGTGWRRQEAGKKSSQSTFACKFRRVMSCLAQRLKHQGYNCGAAHRNLGSLIAGSTTEF
jgi:hypothetical protein